MSEFTYIYDLTAAQAKDFFIDKKQYVNFDLPPYFNFENMLFAAKGLLNNKELKEVCVKAGGKVTYPADYAGVNYVMLSNKDGGFAWRPLQIIHPMLYIDLVNTLTEPAAWKEVKSFFRRRKKSCVECISLPLKSDTSESDKAAAVSNWWDKIEQESLRRSLDYRFLFKTDISNCYPSIYTHSVEWAFALGGRVEIKKKRANGEKTNNLGTKIDKKLQNMNQGQTIGIPQGSSVMDFIAEIVLGATDIELTKRIKSDIEDEDFLILRFRDDYRIFSNDYRTGHRIMKILSDVLYEWNMKMNSSKTDETDDIVTASLKSEKLDEIYISPARLSLQKEAMRIYLLSKKYPNAGLIAKHLTIYYDRLQSLKEREEEKGQPVVMDFEVIISIITLIAYHSPRYMPQVSAIITALIDLSKSEVDRPMIISRILEKFKDVPNTEFIDVWLQRITDSDNITKHDFGSVITKTALSDKVGSSLWNSEWLNKKDRIALESLSISDLTIDIAAGLFSPLISREEFELYRMDYD